ncbi:MAG: hypothetical protein RLZZ292_1373 [Bacteroidota bacterium]|jgi:preprotein translocase subunit SecG
MNYFRFFYFFILILPALVFGSNGKPTFEATCDSRQVVLGSYVEVSFTLHDGRGDDFTPPSFGEFKVLGGPNTAISQSIINGQRSSTYTYSYTLQSKKLGTFSIGAASIRVNGQTLQTQPLSIEVVKGQSNVGGNKGNSRVFVRAETSTREAYLGGQVTLDYKLYTAVNVESVNVLSEPSYKGFFQQEIKNLNAPIVKEVVNGVQYLTKILKRVVLYPQQTGRLEIEGTTFNIAIPSEDERNNPMGGIFSFQDSREVPVAIEAFGINVLPLPANAPDAFSGGVGVYSIASSISRSDATTDDAITMHLTITGEGDIKRVQAPTFNLGEGIEVYEPKIVEEVTEEKNGRLVGRKEIDYILLPKQAGSFSVVPSLTYFDTDKKQYATAALEPYALNIRQGKGKTNTATKLPNQEDNKKEGIFSSSSFAKTFLWAAALFCLLGLGVYFFYKKNKNNEFKNNEFKNLSADRQVQEIQNSNTPNSKPETSNPKLETPNSKPETSNSKIETKTRNFAQARTFLNQGNSQGFYKEIVEIIYAKSAKKFQIAPSELNEETIVEAMQRWNMPNEKIQTMQYVLHTCNLALYAQQENSGQMERVLKEVEGF